MTAYHHIHLYERLAAASAKSGRSLSDEIRTRIEPSLELDALDKPTREFFERIALMPAEIERETGIAWHEHAGAWAAFRKAILKRLMRLKPQGTIVFGPRPHQSNPSDDPEEIGIWAEANLFENPHFTTSRHRAVMEKTFREIMEIHHTRRRQRKGDKS